MTNPVFGFAELAAAQSQPEVVVNASDRAITQALAGQITIDLASDANYTLVADSGAPQDDEWPYGVIRITDTGGVLTAARDIVFPDVDTEHTITHRGTFIFQNDTAQTLTIKRSGQTGVAVLTGTAALVWHNGTDVIEVVNPLG